MKKESKKNKPKVPSKKPKLPSKKPKLPNQRLPKSVKDQLNRIENDVRITLAYVKSISEVLKWHARC